MYISVFSIFVAKAFGNFLGKFNVPYMALPFNLTAVCVFLSLQPHNFTPATKSELDLDLSTNTTLSWEGVGRGILVSMGQVRDNEYRELYNCQPT